jgi:hypothetical protein
MSEITAPRIGTVAPQGTVYGHLGRPAVAPHATSAPWHCPEHDRSAPFGGKIAEDAARSARHGVDVHPVSHPILRPRFPVALPSARPTAAKGQ